MSEQDQTETKQSGGVSGFIGSAVGGATAYVQADKYIAKKGIRNALGFSEKPATVAPAAEIVSPLHTVADTVAEAPSAAKETAKKVDKVAATYAEKTSKILSEGTAESLKKSQKAIEALKNPSNIEKIDDITFTAKTEGKGFSARFSGDGKAVELTNVKKLPEGFTAGESVKDSTKIKEFVAGEKAPLKALLQQEENSVIAGVRKAGGRTMGFRSAGLVGKAGVVAATVAGVVIGGKVLNAAFGGKHTAQVAEQRSEAEVATATR